MSRIIVKNLPHGIKEERLHSLFGSIGQITDCSLKFTKAGKFRKFAFVGFKTVEAAQVAVKQLNKTFIDTSRIEVDIAHDFGDQNKPKAWSKYSKKSSAPKESTKKLADKDELKAKKKNKAKEEVMDELLGELKDDPGFQEFLEAHANVGKKNVWSNDSSIPSKSTSQGKADSDKKDKMELDDEKSSDDASDDNEEERKKSISTKGKKKNLKEDLNKVANKKNLSDLEYLKSKMGETALLSDSDVEANSDTGNLNLEDQEVSQKATQESHEKKESGTKVQQKKYALKLKGLPVIAGEKAVKEFFKPLKPSSIRIPRNAKKKPIGIAYVEFADEKDLEQAMRRNKNFIGGKRIYLKKSEIEAFAAKETVEDSPKPWEKKLQESSIEDEDIAESGRLFVRNLSYCCTEEEMWKLFEKYGPLTEVHLPIDSFTKKLKGFAFITYMIPEHAVKAYAELDGTVFQGRMLHILSGKAKKEDDLEITERSSYKKKKEAKQKTIASSSHNWNTLFLGANAVADLMAEKYGASKSDILDAEKTKSLGVRLALGETQIVSETRDFLLENGVVLDSFSNPAGPRSKSVILVKNLPSGTKSEEIQELFAKFGTVGKIILPPSGITAIVEYLEATEAKAGFTKLAYTKVSKFVDKNEALLSSHPMNDDPEVETFLSHISFKHVPLYLEWAPMDVLKKGTHPSQEKEETDEKDISKTKDQKKKEEDEDAEESESETEPGSMVFVKNLNFDTTEENIKQIFKKCGKIKTVTIARKKDLKNPGQFLSMGYGFVEYRNAESAQRAIKELQHTDLDGHMLELKLSSRVTVQPKTGEKKKRQTSKKQKSTKILVRNIPFEAKKSEVEDLFKVFGELKTVRLPKKLSGTGSHRGFGFVDFMTKQDAKRAFEVLCHSTHLYGRRLVLEWAETADDLEELRKRTAEHYHEDAPKKKLTKAGIIDSLQISQDE